jgi:hypothetical protein
MTETLTTLLASIDADNDVDDKLINGAILSGLPSTNTRLNTPVDTPRSAYPPLVQVTAMESRIVYYNLLETQRYSVEEDRGHFKGR